MAEVATHDFAPTFPASTIITRRSGSIFSRRGTDTPVPQTKPLRMQSSKLSQASSLSPTKSKRWRLKRKSSDFKGTILRAVPTQSLEPCTVPFNPNDRSLAPSPNTEILNSIGKGPGSLKIKENQTSPRITSQPGTPPSTTSPRNPLAHKKSEEDARVIGIWRDGRTHWDSEPPIPLVSVPSDAFVGSPAETLPIRIPHPDLSAPKTARPRIQVMIPNDRRQKPLQEVPFFAPKPIARHSIIPKSSVENFGYSPQAVPNGAFHGEFRTSSADVSDREISPPSVTSNSRPRYSIVSPLSSQSQPKPARPYFKPQPLGIIEQEPEPAEPSHRSRPSLSHSSDSSNNGDDGEDDDASHYSKRSSMTSVGESEGNCPSELPISLHSRPGSLAFSIISPVAAGVFDDEERPNALWSALASPRPPKPLSRFSSNVSKNSRASLRRSSGIRRQTSSAKERVRQSITLQYIHEALSRMDDKEPPSPTLSEAEQDLHKHLTAISPSLTDDTPFKWDDWVQRDMQAAVAQPAPLVPEKSSKRVKSLTRLVPSLPSTSTATLSPAHPPPSRTPTPLSATGSLEAKLKGLKLTIPVNNRPKPVESKAPTPIVVEPEQAGEPDHVLAARAAAVERNISAEAAETVILSILESLRSLDDLFSFAIVNKGFYRVFKRHELSLMQTVLRNQSPPAWEHREISPPYPVNADRDSAAPEPEYTASTYYSFHMRDVYIIAALKSLIVERCQSFLRSETASALVSQDPACVARIDDTFWRIWTFCKIFGCGKGREDDIVAQMDWLRGGPLFHQNGCRATILTHESFDVSNVLASAPDSFAMGNPGGLSAEQLYDMTEIWTCLSVLLQNVQGRTDQARSFGVFDLTEIRGGDIDGEEAMLEEWQHYLLTLGLSTILELAAPVQLPADDPSLFIRAAEAGWTSWVPPVCGGSRKTFLKEAVSRIYEEKISTSFSSSPEQAEMKELAKQRLKDHISELRRRKLSGDYRQQITMSMDRPMSQWETALNALTGPPASTVPAAMVHPAFRNNDLLAVPPANGRMPNPSHQHQQHSRASSSHSTQSARSHQSYQSTPSVQSTQSSQTTQSSHVPQAQPQQARGRLSHEDLTRAVPTFVQPSIEEHPALRQGATDQHPVQREILHSDLAENTADKAIFRIVEMGFTAEQARYALRVTDMGDGLRIDRAVELLLRGA